ncbi:hypothetical protein [Euryhalocaulis sp.]|uniref:magnesium chelatase subunit ChlI family protein n=1 Tax=Euryhalocaulis sp. TaxID=2744307 RepID=UPI00338E2833
MRKSQRPWSNAWPPQTRPASPASPKAAEKMSLSARAYHRILSVACAIADLDDVDLLAPRACRRTPQPPPHAGGKLCGQPGAHSAAAR